MPASLLPVMGMGLPRERDPGDMSRLPWTEEGTRLDLERCMEPEEEEEVVVAGLLERPSAEVERLLVEEADLSLLVLGLSGVATGRGILDSHGMSGEGSSIFFGDTVSRSRGFSSFGFSGSFCCCCCCCCCCCSSTCCCFDFSGSCCWT